VWIEILPPCLRGENGAIFHDRKFAEKCWNHNLEDLVKLADLEALRGIEISANPGLGGNWIIASGWAETSRYQQKNPSRSPGALWRHHTRPGRGAPMDTASLVEKQIDDGRQLIDLLAAKGFEVNAACWLKTGDEGRWFLYIVSRAVDEKGPTPAYGEVARAFQSIPDSWVSMFQVKLIGATSPIAKDVLAIRERHSGMIPPHYRSSLIGGMSVDDIYIYPSVVAGSPLGGGPHMATYRFSDELQMPAVMDVYNFATTRKTANVRVTQAAAMVLLDYGTFSPFALGGDPSGFRTALAAVDALSEDDCCKRLAAALHPIVQRAAAQNTGLDAEAVQALNIDWASVVALLVKFLQSKLLWRIPTPA
jgi:hypothetical protein